MTLNKVVAYYFDNKQVMLKDKANMAMIETIKGKMVDYTIMPKKGYDGSRDICKPVKSWEELPNETSH
jgi:hypothetical protein